MAQMRLALAQINPTVGDLSGNARAIREWTGKAATAGAHLVAFPEMMLTGYPVEDLALLSSFVEASRAALAELATALVSDGHGDLPVVVGYLDQAPYRLSEADRPLPQNCAAVLHQGQVKARYAKHHLPNYGVFDEFRIFAPGKDLTVVRIGEVDVAIAICEDLWQEGGPVAQSRRAGAGLLLVINGSPYERDKDDVRYELVARRAAEAGCTLAYLNMVGGQDELVFDGDSLVVDAAGTVLARGPQFDEDLLVVDLDLEPSTVNVADSSADGVLHVTISDTPTPGYVAAPAALATRLDPVGEIYQCSLGYTTTSARTASGRCCWGSPAGSTRPWWPRSPRMRWVGRTSWRSATRASTPARVPATMLPSLRRTSGWTTASSPSSQ